jgi:hypothetical protein
MKAIQIITAGAILMFSTQAFAATTGDYAKVDCASNPIFTTNGCLANNPNFECFDGGSISAGVALQGLSDKWTNTTTGEQVIYQDEITLPKLVNLGGAGTTWLANPADEKAFWTPGDDVIFTPETVAASGSTGSGAKRNIFSLKAGKSVTILTSELGANYRIERTDRKAGDYVGMIKFPANYRNVDNTTGKPGALVNHIECAVYKLAGSVAAAVPIVKPTTIPPVKIPAEVTKVKTGAADTFLFLGLAFLLGLAFMFARKKRSI